MDRQFTRRIFLVFGNKARALHEHAARPTGGIEDGAVVRLDYFDDKSNDAGRREKLAAFRTFSARELAEKILIDSTECVIIERGGNFGNALEQLF